MRPARSKRSTIAPAMKRSADRRAVVVHHLAQSLGIDFQFIHQQRPQLAVPVLLDDEHMVMGLR